jgi:hypothetical protein
MAASSAGVENGSLLQASPLQIVLVTLAASRYWVLIPIREPVRRFHATGVMAFTTHCGPSRKMLAVPLPAYLAAPGQQERWMRTHLTVVGAALGLIAAWAVWAALLPPQP